jgi:hypothetical protein
MLLISRGERLMGRILGMAEHNAQRQEVAGNGSRKGDIALITALAAGHSIKDAAKIAGIGERTAHRRLDEPVFKERVNDMRAEFLSEAVGRLSDATTEAAKTLRSLLDSTISELMKGCGCKLTFHRLFSSLPLNLQL